MITAAVTPPIAIVTSTNVLNVFVFGLAHSVEVLDELVAFCTSGSSRSKWNKQRLCFGKGLVVKDFSVAWTRRLRLQNKRPIKQFGITFLSILKLFNEETYSPKILTFGSRYSSPIASVERVFYLLVPGRLSDLQLNWVHCFASTLISS